MTGAPKSAKPAKNTNKHFIQLFTMNSRASDVPFFLPSTEKHSAVCGLQPSLP